MKKTKYFTKTECLLWVSSSSLIILSFALFDRSDLLSLVASLIGAASLIFSAKGNPIGPLLMIAFSIFYGAISFTFAYYGEMITYIGMTLPMSLLSFVTWLKHPYKDKKARLQLRKLRVGRWRLCFCFP